MSQINELQQQLDGIQIEMRYLEQHDERYKALEVKANEVQAQIDAAKVEESKQAIETTAQELATSMETYNIGDSSFTLDQLAADDDALTILRKGIAENSQKQAQKWLEDINAQKSVYEQKINALQELLNEKDKAIDTLQNDNAQLHLDNEDISEKRDAAVRVAEEAKAEAQRLNARVDELTQQLAVGVIASNVIDITSDADLEAAAQRLKAKKEVEAREKIEAAQAAKIRIYNVQQLDGTGAKFGANRADNDEYITFGWLEKNKYVELSNEEVERFRQERADAEKAELESIPETATTTEPVSDFPLQAPELSDTLPAGGLVGDETVSEGDADTSSEPVTRAEFEALKQRVDALTNLSEVVVADVEQLKAVA